jgi:hypothetical protein
MLAATGSMWSPPETAAESPTGIVGVATLIGVADRRLGRFRALFQQSAGNDFIRELELLVDDRWWAGPVGWLLDDVVAIEPIACAGAQGLWDLELNLENEVRRRVVLARRGAA